MREPPTKERWWRAKPTGSRAKQSASFQAEDFKRFFVCTRRLAEVCPDYAASYEFHVHGVLHALARVEPDLFFLQVGGMDGKRFDPIYAFVKHYRWKGIILEPLPDLFETLAANYAGTERVILVNAALTDRDGEHEMFRVQRQAVLDGVVPLWAEGLSPPFPAPQRPGRPRRRRTCTRRFAVTCRSNGSTA